MSQFPCDAEFPLGFSYTLEFPTDRFHKSEATSVKNAIGYQAVVGCNKSPHHDQKNFNEEEPSQLDGGIRYTAGQRGVRSFEPMVNTMHLSQHLLSEKSGDVD